MNKTGKSEDIVLFSIIMKEIQENSINWESDEENEKPEKETLVNRSGRKHNATAVY
ncbi:MAG: hypothetical protein JW881_12045 [Spirochaetales bacterium]|nr:hypothetical protein [Spirochaetales bacterium]